MIDALHYGRFVYDSIHIMAISSERAGAFQKGHWFTAAGGGQNIVLVRSTVDERPRNLVETQMQSIHFYHSLILFFLCQTLTGQSLHRHMPHLTSIDILVPNVLVVFEG